jgi:hypothetical protein
MKANNWVWKYGVSRCTEERMDDFTICRVRVLKISGHFSSTKIEGMAKQYPNRTHSAGTKVY